MYAAAMSVSRIWASVLVLALVGVGLVTACGDDDEPGLSPAQLHGVGAACSSESECVVGDEQLACLPFKGGYCGLQGCNADDECPAGSACVAHEDGERYCFLVCREKPECNYTRPADIESNCASNITFVDGTKGRKACVPPS